MLLALLADTILSPDSAVNSRSKRIVLLHTSGSACHRLIQ